VNEDRTFRHACVQRGGREIVHLRNVAYLAAMPGEIRVLPQPDRGVADIADVGIVDDGNGRVGHELGQAGVDFRLQSGDQRRRGYDGHWAISPKNSRLTAVSTSRSRARLRSSRCGRRSTSRLKTYCLRMEGVWLCEPPCATR